MTKYTVRPTCGHVSMGYKTLRLAKAHAQAHADTCGAPLSITREDATPVLVATINPRTAGPFRTCRPQGENDPMWQYND